jgi:hypothetical protein
VQVLKNDEYVIHNKEGYNNMVVLSNGNLTFTATPNMSSQGEFEWTVRWYNGGSPVVDDAVPETEGSVDQQIQQLLNSGWKVEDPDEWQGKSQNNPVVSRGYH